MPTLRPGSFLRSLAAPALLLAAACTDTQFVERPLFNPPVDSVNGFLGYQTASTKKTSCGNCHVGTQRQWLTSAHTEAWAGLQAAGAAVQPACYACHGVSENGNRIAAAAGISLANDTAYHDVQCESCHGPGLQHVQNPEVRANVPLARANITTGYSTTTGEETGLDLDASCAACHGAVHGQPSLAAEWATSRHGRIQVGAVTRAECVSCHDGKATIAWLGGEASNYVERTNTTAGQQQYFPVTCTACHDPHGSENAGMLRASISTPELQRNLCMSCHNRSATPSGSFTSGGRGAHSAQGPIVAGFGFGYIPQGFLFDSSSAAATAHNSTRNPRLCAGCHVNSYEVTDPQAGTLRYSGHRFLAIPCVGANGLPTDTQTCAETVQARSWASCVSAGCHTSADNARTIFVAKAAEVQTLVNTIFRNLNGNVSSSGSAIVDAAPTDAGFLATIRQAQAAGNPVAANAFASDGRLSAAEGALYNVYTLAPDLYSHKDGSKGTHNPAYYTALLAATIEDLRARYPGLGLRVEPPVQAIIDRALSQPGVTYRRPVDVSSR